MPIVTNHDPLDLPRLANGCQVIFAPCAPGLVRMVGLDPNGQWLGEMMCRECDCSAELVEAVQRRVASWGPQLPTGPHLVR
jgi:hypothetical protein